MKGDRFKVLGIAAIAAALKGWKGTAILAAFVLALTLPAHVAADEETDAEAAQELAYEAEPGWAMVAGRIDFHGFSAHHIVAVSKDGTLWAWGGNHYGQLGDGTRTNRGQPVRIGTADNWAAVAAGDRHTLAVTTDGELWAWGNNHSGQLGDGTNMHRAAPVRVGTADNWRAVSAGGNSSFAINAAGHLFVWGNNNWGQLGDGTTASRNAPVRVGTTWTSVATSGHHTAAISADGSLWSWGSNFHGELGDGTWQNRNRPVRTGTAADWVHVTVTGGSTAGIRRDGSLWAWGSKGWLRGANTPTREGSSANWALTAGQSLAIRTDGTLWLLRYESGWGTSYVQVVADAVLASVSGGMFLGTDGSLWALFWPDTVPPSAVLHRSFSPPAIN